MKAETCPKCGGLNVRTAHLYLRHLARLARGSRYRYCCDCRTRWKAQETAFSPWAMLGAAVPVAAMLRWLWR